jgi:hypothetical protein
MYKITQKMHAVKIIEFALENVKQKFISLKLIAPGIYIKSKA